MVFTVELTPEEEQRVEKARKIGINVEAMFHGLIAALPPVGTAPEVEDHTLELFAQWERDAQQMTPEEIAEEDARTEEFDRNMAESQGEIRLRVPDVAEHDYD